MAIALNNKNQFDWLQALLFGIIICFFLFLCSCSCEYHLKRAKAKCSLNQLTDTVKQIIEIKVPEISGKDSAKTNADFSFFENKLDSVLSVNKGLDSLYKQALKKTLIGAYKSKICLKDTFTIIPKEGAYIKFWQEGELFKCDYFFPSDTIKKEVPVLVNKTELKDNWSDLKWYLLLLIILFALYKITK